MGAKSHRVGSSLCREGSYLKGCFLWERHHSVLVARFGEKTVIGRRVGGSKIAACRSLCREGCNWGSGPGSLSVACTSSPAALGELSKVTPIRLVSSTFYWGPISWRTVRPFPLWLLWLLTALRACLLTTMSPRREHRAVATAVVPAAEVENTKIGISTIS